MERMVKMGNLIVSILLLICLWFGCTENGKHQLEEINNNGVKNIAERVWYGDNNTVGD